MMVYEPFFDMNVLLSSQAYYSLFVILGCLIAFHVFLAVFLILRLVYLFKKSGLRLAAPRI